MAMRIPIEKKAKVIALHDEGALPAHIAICTRLKKSTVKDILKRVRHERGMFNRTAGCQDQGPSLAEIYAERDRINASWSDEERERRLAGAYRPLPAIMECDRGDRHWNGILW